MAHVLRLVPPPAGDDGFHEIYDGLANEIDSLRCGLAALRSRTDLDEELLAALSLLTRATRRIDELHTEFDGWNLRRRRRPLAHS
jgi:hypothetical protein